MVDIYNYIKELTKLELIYKDKNGVPRQLKSHVKSIDNHRLLIAPPEERGKAMDIPDGTKIKMIICTDQGIFSGFANILEREISSTPGLWISYPYNNQHCQRREYMRVPIHVDCELIINRDKDRINKDIVKFKTKNLSGKGMNFFTDEHLGDYYDIQCKMFLKDNHDEPIEITCDHIYTKRVRMPEGKKYLHAIYFSNISDFDVERIVKACFKYQLETRRNEKFYSL